MQNTLLAPSHNSVCVRCSSELEHGSKFCGECGCTCAPVSYQEMHGSSAEQRQCFTGQYQIPGFEESSSAGYSSENSMAADQIFATRHARNGRNNLPPGSSFTVRANTISRVASTTSTTLDQPVPEIIPTENKEVCYGDLERLNSFRLANSQGQETGWKPTPSPLEGQVNHSAPTGAPMFANVAASRKGAVNPQLVREMQSLDALLLRERIFLIMHWLIFLIANLTGFFLALECYNGFAGDEVTKLVMALTPLTFINAVALCCLAPIKGTRNEIARIQEKMQYVRFQMEIGHVI